MLIVNYSTCSMLLPNFPFLYFHWRHDGVINFPAYTADPFKNRDPP